MQNYCENNSVCRRKYFHDIFHEQTSNSTKPGAIKTGKSILQVDSTLQGFRPCGSMCDICRKKYSNSSSSLASTSQSTSSISRPKSAFQRASDILSTKSSGADKVLTIGQDEEEGWITSRRSVDKTTNIKVDRKRSSNVIVINDDDEDQTNKKFKIKSRQAD